MQAEQQPRRTDETDDEFNEWNQQYNQNENEKADEEKRHNEWQSLGGTALDSSIIDSDESHEETAESERKRKEKIAESYSFLKTRFYKEEQIDALLCETDYATTQDENGEEIYKRTEEGELIPYINKNKLKQSFEYMFDWGISIKDLSDGGIIDMGIDFPGDIEKFVQDYYYITDLEYYPKFNNEYSPMRSLHSIIEKRKKHEPLSEQDRDFAYACYQENINIGAKYPYSVDTDDIAGRLLFGGAPSQYRSEGLSEEAKRVINDPTDKYLTRISHLDAERRDLSGETLSEGDLRQKYEEASLLIKKSVRVNLHNILSDIGKTKDALDNHLLGNDFDLEDSESYALREHLASIGATLLRNYKFMGANQAIEGKDGALNPTGIGLGEALIACGYSPDNIIDTYFDGDYRVESSNYEPSYAYLEARKVKQLMDIGIPKEAIIANIREKSEGKNPINNYFRISEEEVKNMREAGISNPDILDAMATEPASVVARPNKYHEMGFTDSDIIKYLVLRLKRTEGQK